MLPQRAGPLLPLAAQLAPDPRLHQLGLLVIRLWELPFVKYSLKCAGPLPNTVLWISPSIAMSRLASIGAK